MEKDSQSSAKCVPDVELIRNRGRRAQEMLDRRIMGVQ